MKAVSAIIAIILILMIVIALAALFYMFSSSLFTSITQTGSSSITHLTEALSSCMKIESIYQNKIYLRNCGQGIITNDTLNIYIDDNKFDFFMSPQSINNGKLATIIMPIWGISVGDHSLKITNPNIELIKTVESVLPDSCVLALDFDEGTGTIAYDKSRYSNNGKTQNGSIIICSGGDCPNWVDGKVSKAVKLDGSNDFVNVSNSISLELTNQFTISAWFRPSRDMIDFGTTGYYGGVGKKAGGDVDYGIYWCDGAKGWKVEFFDNGGGRHDMSIVGGYPVYSNVWYYVTGTYDGTYLRLYVNGTEKANQNIGSFTIRKLGEPFEVGHYKTWPQPYWNGTIDSVRVYNKALTPDETVILKIK